MLTFASKFLSWNQIFISFLETCPLFNFLENEMLSL